jgi:hypothetical protein
MVTKEIQELQAQLVLLGNLVKGVKWGLKVPQDLKEKLDHQDPQDRKDNLVLEANLVPLDSLDSQVQLDHRENEDSQDKLGQEER